MPWRIRFRLGYLKKYGWFERFAFGFLLGPLFFYKTGHVVYVKKWVDDFALKRTLIDLVGFTYDEAKEELFKSVPYDFGFPSIESFVDYEIDTNRHRFLLQGVPRPTKE